MTFKLLFVLSSLALLFFTLVAKDANWPRHEIFSGSVNSATAHDYDKDGDQEILFSADRRSSTLWAVTKEASHSGGGPKYAQNDARASTASA